MSKLTLFWFRRDLRLKDNHGLFRAMTASSHVQPLFIFDSNILKKISRKEDDRVNFIFETLTQLKKELNEAGSDLWVFHGDPLAIFKKIAQDHALEAVFANQDYEPYAAQRDSLVQDYLKKQAIDFKTFKDQVIFEKSEILTGSEKPYTVFTPYKKKWLSCLLKEHCRAYESESLLKNLNKMRTRQPLIPIEEIGFKSISRTYPSSQISPAVLKEYHQRKDYPALEDGTSRLGLHLRFGTVSVRHCVQMAKKHSETWLSELIWREFFMQILWHFPHVEKQSFRSLYDNISWRKDKNDFHRWKEGQTGYPLVDAGMRELKQTGFMPNRVRMVAASFLCKHLLIHWSQGERHFADLLLDYDLAANNGNWQWVAGSGCDAAPYFRVFNPRLQLEKFDRDEKYIRKWLPEYGTKNYPEAMVDHSFAVRRSLLEYNKVLKGKKGQ